MLEIKHHHMHFPELHLELPRKVELATVAFKANELADELASAILNDPIDHDNNWTLEERPDPGKLEAFWDQVVEDVQNDPEWSTFAED